MILVCIKEIPHGRFTIGNKYETKDKYEYFDRGRKFLFIEDDDGNYRTFSIVDHLQPETVIGIEEYFIPIEEWREIKLGELGIL